MTNGGQTAPESRPPSQVVGIFRFVTFISCALLSLMGCGSGRAADKGQGDVYGYGFTGITGEPLPLSQFKGHVLLIVNTASRCGFTRQYDGLQKLYETYKDKGLVVIGVPSNDFGNQESGNAAEIKKFCETNFNITFPLTQKVDVVGDNAHPLFKKIREEKGFLASPHWNFYKYLIGRDGRITNWFPSTTPPESEDLKKAIEAELAGK